MLVAGVQLVRLTVRLLEPVLGVMNRTYWWPRMSKDVTNFVKACELCFRTKIPRSAPPAKLLISWARRPPEKNPKRGGPFAQWKLGPTFAWSRHDSGHVASVLIIMDLAGAGETPGPKPARELIRRMCPAAKALRGPPTAVHAASSLPVHWWLIACE